MRFGVVGYGTGGRHFHAPFIAAAKGISLAGVVARAPNTIAAVQEDLPDTPIYPSLTAMLEAGVDAVTITTPPHTRRELVLEAIEAGVPVIADKPFAPSAKAGRDLAAKAEAAGVILGVYHNRRWDADIQTLRRVLTEGRIGDLWRFHSRMDFDDPATIEAGPTGGLLRDLGSHLVDQAIWLAGPVTSVYANLDIVTLKEGETDAGFVLTLRHKNGVVSHLSASKLNQMNARELRAYGSAGGYVSRGTDVQAQAIFAGKRPADDLEGWGYEQPDRLGRVFTKDGEREVASEQGKYHAYYEAFAEAVRTGGRPPVTAEDAIATLAVLDAARLSATEGRVAAVAEADEV